jgi:hypothetical protein
MEIYWDLDKNFDNGIEDFFLWCAMVMGVGQDMNHSTRMRGRRVKA